MKDIFVERDDSLESLATIGELLGNAGVNIEGLCLSTRNGRSAIHLVVEDDITATHVLESSGINVLKVSEVFVLHKDNWRVTGKPGSFGGICRLLADHGIKMEFGYPAENNRFIFGVDNIKKTQELLE